MFETLSVFDAIAAEDTDHRIASRRALALAHTRVESHLGRYLRGAQSLEEFEARMAAVEDEFLAYVATASEESGHDRPEFIARSLVDHYVREAGGKPPWLKDDDEDDEKGEEKKDDEKDDEKDEKTAGANMMQQPGLQLPPNPNEQQMMPGAPAAPGVMPAPGAPDPAAMALQGDVPQGQHPMTGGNPGAAAAGQAGVPPLGQAQVPGLNRFMGGHKWAAQPLSEEDEKLFPKKDPEGNQDKEASSAQETYEQNDDSSRKVACPECGGDGKTANDKACPKCHGAGKVNNFGDSMLDKLGAGGNTDLGGPEPKMDKRLWTPQTVGDPTPDSKQYPTKKKDILVPMKGKNEDELTEIGEQTTERVKLPAGQWDTAHGFYDGGQEFGPHTKTWTSEPGAADPVTQDVGAPHLVSSSVKEALTARDFVMLADAIAKAPEGADKATLAGHFANYLQHTNPNFDAERFMAAAGGSPASGRDVFKGPGGPAPQNPFPGDEHSEPFPSPTYMDGDERDVPPLR